jgi:hypothetical protein
MQGKWAIANCAAAWALQVQRRARLKCEAAATRQSKGHFGGAALAPKAPSSREGMCRTYGALHFSLDYPALTRWAKLCRAYGTGLQIAGKIGPRFLLATQEDETSPRQAKFNGVPADDRMRKTEWRWLRG